MLDRYRLRAWLFLFVIPLVFPAAGWTQTTVSSAERTLLDAANRDRKAQGLPLLRWNEALADAARKHAQRMAQQDSLSHQLSGEPNLSARVIEAGVRFTWVAENVGEGFSVSEIHEQLMRSPAHRAGILDPELECVGIGVAEHNGRWFAAEDFLRRDSTSAQARKLVAASP